MKALPLAGALAFILLTTPAWAVPIGMTVYTDRAAFDAAAGPYTLLTLDAPDPGTFGVDSCSSSVPTCHVTYGGGLLWTHIDWNPGCGVFGEICFANYNLSGGVTPLVTAFGFDVPQANTERFLEDGSAVNAPEAAAAVMDQQFQVVQGGFYGWVSPVPFAVTFYLPSPGDDGIQGWTMDNVAIQVAQAVPEPASWLLLGVGLLGLAAWQWQRRPTT